MRTWRFFVIDAEGDYQTDEWRNTTSTTSFTNEYYTVLFTAQHYRHVEPTVSRQSVWWKYNRMQLLYSSPVLSDQLMMRAIIAKADTAAAPATDPALGGYTVIQGAPKK